MNDLLADGSWPAILAYIIQEGRQTKDLDVVVAYSARRYQTPYQQAEALAWAQQKTGYGLQLLR
ncbi:hypothetical protein [Spirosoma sordidisoli]|uniref:Uncharacterized protein n=1 Tax=Spirosoma sordidisoli TaxID=2502893 RepID=A0A4Q2UK98_9BACT|nr:hypothetical protein [Spirosoma sordidisoli]RYC69626.1 hypothetical protein EQG79_13565 [Spirosoma sordidisoli]